VIGQSLPDVIGMILCLSDQCSHMLIIDGIVDDVAISTRLDYPSIAQKPQLM